MREFLTIILWFFTMVFVNGQSSFDSTDVVSPCLYADSHLFQLTKPQLIGEQAFFKKTNFITLEHRMKNSSIHFTLDGTEPTINSFLYTRPIQWRRSGRIKAKSFHKDLKTSELVVFEFFKIDTNIAIENIEIKQTPNENYAGEGTSTLINGQKGTLNFRTKAWLGFAEKEIEIILFLKEKQPIETITISTLINTGAWIFPPKSVEIWYTNNADEFTKIAIENYPIPTAETPDSFKYLTLKFAPKATRKIKLILRNMESLPEWHAGKGNLGWLFLDEILVN